MRVRFYETNQEGKRLEFIEESVMNYVNTDAIEEQGHPNDVEQNIVNIHDDVEYQSYGGIGGAFTESSAIVWKSMTVSQKEEVLKAYFDPEEGIGYDFGRLSIASNDFSAGDYTYVAEGDETLDTFDISRDEEAVFPMVRSAKKYNQIKLFASPWSPPAYMKTSNSRIGGHLKKEYYGLWAKYFRKYINACKEHDVDIWAVTMQNEPRHHQDWESCLYTPEEEAEFLGYLGQELEGSGVKIICYDHCRERVFERAKAIFESKNGNYCDGIANHWYSGTHFGELRALNTKYPEKISIASEGCNPIPGGILPEYDLVTAEKYAHDISGCFNHGLHYYCDWNMILDQNNGPYHNREKRPCQCDAAVFYHTETKEIIYRLTYYYIGHYSKFAKSGAKVIAVSSYDVEVEALALKNPDESVVCVLLNRTDKEKQCILRMDGCIKEVMLKPHSIITAYITDDEERELSDKTHKA